MIREDYLIGWIKRFVHFLTEISGLLKTGQHQAARQRMDIVLRELLGLGADSMISLSEGEILARLIVGEPTVLVQEKCLVLSAVLDQLGTVIAAQGRHEESQECYLKALHLALGVLLRDDQVALPEYAPKVEDLLQKLKATRLDPRTQATLMVYYEQSRQYAKAEDVLFALLDNEPHNADLLAIGVAFYDRLLQRDEVELAGGDLPRPEVESGRREILARRHRP
jgi:tetratricopeptide (TPR) repeat protein